MNVLKSVLVLSVFLGVLASCNKDDVVPFEAKFEVSVTGTAPNASIAITNQTTGASTYEWVYSEGASEEGSSLENPAGFTVDKAGEFTVTLKATSGSEEKTSEAKVTIVGNSAILSFTDLEFGLSAGSDTYGRLFSIDEAKIYKDSEISTEMTPKVDLAFGSLAYTMYFFESPDDPDFQLTEAAKTKVDNSVSTDEFTVTTFDSMVDDAGIKDVVITDTEESFGNSQPNLVLFETASGRKGVIKTTAVNSDRLLVTIKVQKY